MICLLMLERVADFCGITGANFYELISVGAPRGAIHRWSAAVQPVGAVNVVVGVAAARRRDHMHRRHDNRLRQFLNYCQFTLRLSVTFTVPPT